MCASNWIWFFFCSPFCEGLTCIKNKRTNREQERVKACKKKLRKTLLDDSRQQNENQTKLKRENTQKITQKRRLKNGFKTFNCHSSVKSCWSGFGFFFHSFEDWETLPSPAAALTRADDDDCLLRVKLEQQHGGAMIMKNKLGKRSKQKINFICTWTTLAAGRGSEWANRKKWK